VPQRRPGRGGKENKSLFLPGIEPPVRPAHSLVYLYTVIGIIELHVLTTSHHYKAVRFHKIIIKKFANKFSRRFS
jgi:hypothetical protein